MLKTGSLRLRAYIHWQYRSLHITSKLPLLIFLLNKAQQKRYESLYQQHVNALKRQGKSKATIDGYYRAVRRISSHFERCPDRLKLDDLKEYFSSLIESHCAGMYRCREAHGCARAAIVQGCTGVAKHMDVRERPFLEKVKLDRCGLQFFDKHVLGKQWQWVDIIKPPVVRTLPDILTPDELSSIINATREARYQTYIVTAFSVGLRLGEALNLKIGDIAGMDAGRGRELGAEALMPNSNVSTFAKVRVSRTVFCSYKNCIPHIHVHNRYVTLPDITLVALRHYWSTHRNPCFLFPLGKT